MAQSPKRQKQLSSFFTKSSPSSSSKFFTQPQTQTKKRGADSSFVDLTLSDQDSADEAPVSKKAKPNASVWKGAKERSKLREIQPHPLFVAKKAVASSEPQPGPFRPLPRVPIERYKLGEAASDEVVSPEVLKEKERRREAFRKKLLSDSLNRRQFESSSGLSATQALRISRESDDESVLDGNDEENVSKLPASIASKAFSSGKGKGKENGLTPFPLSGSAKKGKVVEELGPSGKTYTPLEKQVKALKKQYSDALLMFEVGYKYRFFGEDARTAAGVLNIACFPDRNFLTASIPDHRRDIHLRRLLSHGYKVGIIGQTETAALKKVGDNRSGPFERALTHMYTAATYIDEIDVDEDSRTAPPVFMCIVESLLGGMGADERVSISLVVVTPSTGDVVWDEFSDGFMRNELETRLAHIRPSEVLVSRKGLSKVTEKVLNFHTKKVSSQAQARDRMRLEKYPDDVSYSDAFKRMQDFYAQKDKLNASESFASGKLFAAVNDLPKNAIVALAHSLDYLRTFDLSDVLTQTRFFNKFSERQHMLLNANTLSNLEIFRNQTDFSVNGSLVWVIDRTKTPFGARLLRNWIGRPLIDVEGLKSRTDAVETIISANSNLCRERLHRLRELLKDIGSLDLAKGLSRIQYKKCNPRELAKLVRAFAKIGDAFEPFESSESVGFDDIVLNETIFALPSVRASVRKIVSCFNLKSAEEDKRDELWMDPDKYPLIDDAKMGLLSVESELVDHLKTIRKIIKKPAAQYVTVAQDEYLIEVGKNEKREIPLTWEVVSSTKNLRRYRTPEVKRKLQERAQFQEKLAAEANKAYLSFLGEIMDEHYTVLRNAVNKLAVVDCLFSLAEVASQGDYVKPEFVNDGSDVLEITAGRHPMVEMLRSDPFVPNSLCIGGKQSRTKVITGPNMGGKSSTVRMVALIALLAQIGSYVPAASVRLSPLDAILTRMGASDDLARGRSTFMVEMSETSDILHTATSRSLVILDELGRGSSTFDGMAIAGATLEHLTKNIQSKTLFITHYPETALSAERAFPGMVSNLHMGFNEQIDIEGKRIIIFLYKLSEGISSGSYGIECARLAAVPEELLAVASTKAAEMQTLVQNRAQVARALKACSMIRRLSTIGNDGQRTSAVQTFRTLVNTLLP